MEPRGPGWLAWLGFLPILGFALRAELWEEQRSFRVLEERPVGAKRAFALGMAP